jgi:hypothetical protein
VFENIPRRSFLQELGDEFLRLLDNFRALAIIVLVRVFSLTRPSDTSMVSKKSISSDQKLKSGPSRKPDTEPQPKANVPAERSLPASSEHDNLLLCLTERHRTTIIGHIQLDAFKSDNELFTYLREIFYRQSPLRAPKQITYVQV